jgi:hypothetical protein
MVLLFDQHYRRYLKGIDCSHLWNGAVEVYVGREISISTFAVPSRDRGKGGPWVPCPPPFSADNKKVPDKIQPACVK